MSVSVQISIYIIIHICHIIIHICHIIIQISISTRQCQYESVSVQKQMLTNLVENDAHALYKDTYKDIQGHIQGHLRTHARTFQDIQGHM